MKFGTVIRDDETGITIMYIGTLVRPYKVVEGNRDCTPGDVMMVTLDQGASSGVPGVPDDYWPVGETGWLYNDNWGQVVDE